MNRARREPRLRKSDSHVPAERVRPRACRGCSGPSRPRRGGGTRSRSGTWNRRGRGPRTTRDSEEIVTRRRFRRDRSRLVGLAQAVGNEERPATGTGMDEGRLDRPLQIVLASSGTSPRRGRRRRRRGGRAARRACHPGRARTPGSAAGSPASMSGDRSTRVISKRALRCEALFPPPLPSSRRVRRRRGERLEDRSITRRLVRVVRRSGQDGNQGASSV